MRRADRLFQIVNVLRQRRTSTTAAHLAQRTGVSERTIYRDIRDLILSGTPIDGEAGVGYRIRPGASLPPLMFDRDEIQALVLGARIVRRFGDPVLARASDAILNKVASVVPKELAGLLSETRLLVPRSFGTARSGGTLNAVREALTARRKLQLDYAAPGSQLTGRTVRPLGLFFWGQQWTLAASTRSSSTNRARR
jgi:predicted DNA-binding transcriptional regulator YafY